MRVVRIKDVIFDKTLFYDLAKLDSKHLLITNVEETLKIIEISDNIFFEMIIEEDENDQMIDHLENESIESRFVKSAYQVEKTFFLHTDMKNIYLLILEMISDRDQKFNANIIDTMLLLQIDLKIDEILNSDQNQDVQEASNLDSSIENESQSQSSIKSKKSKQSMIVLADAMIMNIRSRKQTYSTALITIETLRSFYAAFSIDLKRSNQKKSQISKLHRDDLFVESRY
jgi:FtsZ-binding cell division protein ZapB